MGLKATWGFLPQQGLREREHFIKPAASSDGGVGPRWSTRCLHGNHLEKEEQQ